MPNYKELTQGPRYKSYATRLFEKIIGDILDGEKAHFSYNVLGELEAQVQGKVFNLTDILSNKVDFRQLSFSDEQLDKFSFGGPSQSEDNYKLHWAEKEAIFIYTSPYFKKIQSFLRQNGRGSYSSGNIKKILLTTAIASHGLAKPINESSDYGKRVAAYYKKDIAALKNQRVIRKERKSSFVEQRMNAIDNSIHATDKDKNEILAIVNNQGFTSTSSELGVYKEAFFYSVSNKLFQPIALNSLGKHVAQFSSFPIEDEVLFPPNTQIQYGDYQQTGSLFKSINFEGRPVYSLDGIDPFSYSEQQALQHELVIIQQMFDKQYQSCQKGFFSRFFTNKIKLNELRVQAHLMNNFLKKEHIMDEDLLELIFNLKKHGCTSNPAWPVIEKRLDRLFKQYEGLLEKRTEVLSSPK